jgi:membrane-associated protease RseP (regulator of RpoE activity)
MMTVRICKRAGLSKWAVGCIALALMGSQGKVAAQEPELTWVPQEKARIGVLLEEVCEATPTADAVCDTPPVVTSVVVNGPADQAGVHARDTLLTVNGMDVTRADGRTLLLGLEAGVPVELQLGREGGRTTIDVTPELRATEPYVEVRTFFGPPEELAEGARSRVRVVRIPSVRTRLDEVEVRLDSMQALGDDFVFFQQDTDGHFNIEVGDRDNAHVILQRMREHEAWPDGTGVSVWENEELAHRLALVRDSSFQSARVRLDSLVRLRGQFQVLKGGSLGFSLSVTSEADPDGEWAYYVRPRAVPSQLRTLLLSDLRIGGAEFRQLSRDLAEYFDGVDEGLLVLRVLRDTPAERMGLKDGDVVVEANGHKCNSIKVLRDAVNGAGSGRAVEVKWIRKGQTHVGNLNAR